MGRSHNNRGWKSYREALLFFLGDRDGWLCGLCGHSVSPADAEIDHIRPVFLGGPHRVSNLRLVHPVCHYHRSDGRGRDYKRSSYLQT